MSINIANGFKFKTSNFVEINEIINVLRTELRVTQLEHERKFLAERSTQLLDNACYNNKIEELKKNAPFIQAYTELNTGYQNGKTSLEFNISIIPFNNEVFGLVHSNLESAVDSFLNKDIVEDFSYWTDTEKPAEVSEEAWINRFNTWKSVLNDFLTPPGMAGFTATCLVPGVLVSTVEEVLPLVPSMQKRIRAVVLEDIFNTEHRKGLTPQNLAQVMKNFEVWVSSEEGKKIIEERENVATKFLRLTVTKEILLGTL